MFRKGPPTLPPQAGSYCRFGAECVKTVFVSSSTTTMKLLQFIFCPVSMSYQLVREMRDDGGPELASKPRPIHATIN